MFRSSPLIFVGDHLDVGQPHLLAPQAWLAALWAQIQLRALSGDSYSDPKVLMGEAAALGPKMQVSPNLHRGQGDIPCWLLSRPAPRLSGAQIFRSSPLTFGPVN